MDYCANCKLELDKQRIPLRRIGERDFCQLCYELCEAVASNPHFLAAQVEYHAERERLKRLLPGSNYLG